MLILARDEIYMFDRDNTVFAVPQFTFPRRKKIEEHVENTLVDGVSLCQRQQPLLMTDEHVCRQAVGQTRRQTDKNG